MKLEKFFLIILLTFFLVKPVFSTADIEEGLQYYYRGNLQEALDEFKSVVEVDAPDARAYFFLGNTYSRLEDYESARWAYEEALQIDPGYKTAKDRLADLLFNREKWEGAVGQYRDLVEEDPDNFEYRFRLGVALLEFEVPEEAREHLEYALEQNPHSDRVHYYFGRLKLVRQNLNEAEDYFDQAIELEPSAGEYYFYRGLSHFRREDLLDVDKKHKSEADFREAIEAGYDTPRSRFMLGNYLLKQGLSLLRQNDEVEGIEKLRLAISHYRRVLMNDWQASNAYHNMGVAYLGIGEYRLARRALEKALEVEPAVPFFQDTYGLIHFRLGEFEEAIEAWERVRALDEEGEGNPFAELLDLKPLSERIREARLRR